MSYAEKRRILNKAVSDWVDAHGNTRCVEDNGREALVQKAIEARPPGAISSKDASKRVSSLLGVTRKVINDMQRQNGSSIDDNDNDSDNASDNDSLVLVHIVLSSRYRSRVVRLHYFNLDVDLSI